MHKSRKYEGNNLLRKPPNPVCYKSSSQHQRVAPSLGKVTKTGRERLDSVSSVYFLPYWKQILETRDTKWDNTVLSCTFFSRP